MLFGSGLLPGMFVITISCSDLSFSGLETMMFSDIELGSESTVRSMNLVLSVLSGRIGESEKDESLSSLDLPLLRDLYAFN